jgi:hypothetical protein
MAPCAAPRVPLAVVLAAGLLALGGCGDDDGGSSVQGASQPVRISGDQVAQQLEADLDAKGFTGAQVTCPSEITVELGSNFTCDVTGGKGSATGTVTFSFLAADGEVDAASVQAS